MIGGSLWHDNTPFSVWEEAPYNPSGKFNFPRKYDTSAHQKQCIFSYTQFLRFSQNWLLLLWALFFMCCLKLGNVLAVGECGQERYCSRSCRQACRGGLLPLPNITLAIYPAICLFWTNHFTPAAHVCVGSKIYNAMNSNERLRMD